jgi:hypothetical protein
VLGSQRQVHFLGCSAYSRYIVEFLAVLQDCFEFTGRLLKNMASRGRGVLLWKVWHGSGTVDVPPFGVLIHIELVQESLLDSRLT